jgi:hypothetical protein
VLVHGAAGVAALGRDLLDGGREVPTTQEDREPCPDEHLPGALLLFGTREPLHVVTFIQ